MTARSNLLVICPTRSITSVWHSKQEKKLAVASIHNNCSVRDGFEGWGWRWKWCRARLETL